MLKIFICGNVYQLIKTSMMKNLLAEMLYQIKRINSKVICPTSNQFSFQDNITHF